MTHLEHYVDCLKLFPADFARDMSLLQSLDLKLNSVNQAINQLQDQLLNMAHDPNNDWAHEIQLAMQHQNCQSNSQTTNQTSNQSNNHIHSDQIPNQSPGPSNAPPNGQPNGQPNSQPNGHPNHPNHNTNSTAGNPQPTLITIHSHPHFLQMLSELRHREQIAAALSEEKLSLASAIKENVSSYVHRLESEKSMFESEMGSELVKEAVASVDQKAKRSSFGISQSSHHSVSQTINPIKKRVSTTLKQEKLYVNRERERDRVKAQDLRVSDSVDFDAFEMNDISQSINLSDFAANFHMQDDSLHSSMPISQSTSHSMSLPLMTQNEEVYCFCRMPDFGEEMILCDQNDGGCNEWFHFSCVKLTKKPKRRWLCPECRKK